MKAGSGHQVWENFDCGLQLKSGNEVCIISCNFLIMLLQSVRFHASVLTCYFCISKSSSQSVSGHMIRVTLSLLFVSEEEERRMGEDDTGNLMYLLLSSLLHLLN